MPVAVGSAPPTLMEYRYRDSVIEELWRHGVHPTPRTSPELVREFLNDLYRYQLRRLRDRLVRGEIPKAGYYDRVVELRLRYPLLSVKPLQWLE
ncbi:MAG: hypothetical protein ACRD2A_11370 [Vicinamibacterales bacterium]